MQAVQGVTSLAEVCAELVESMDGASLEPQLPQQVNKAML